MTTRLILASASPRRRQLLTEAGYEFDVEASGVHEPEPGPGIAPAFYVANLAWWKAAAIAGLGRKGLILAADTVCAVDGAILTKPADRADAERMIRLQEGRDSDVLTAICLLHAGRWEWVGAVETSVVQFRTLSDSERKGYLNSERWKGKAGGYGIQDQDPFITVVRGSFSNVVGLPMERLEALLSEHPGLTT